MNYKKFKLSHSQLESVAQISLDIAQVCLAGFVIEPVVSGSIDWILVFSGFLLSFGFWCVNLVIIRKYE